MSVTNTTDTIDGIEITRAGNQDFIGIGLDIRLVIYDMIARVSI